MIFQENLELNEHSELIGKHAPFSPSQHYWIDYSPEKLLAYWDNKDAQLVGTKVHQHAADLINMHYDFLEMGLPSPVSLIFKARKKDTVSLHVTHSAQHWLGAEVPVKYSDICFGTADAIGFHIPTKTLYVNDLKTGKIQGDMRQLEQYAAIFLAEYSSALQFQHHINLNECKIQLRIFQYDDCVLAEPPADYILNEVLEKARRQHEVLAEALDRRGQ